MTDDRTLKPFTEAERKAWEEWLATRPPHVRAVCEKYPPDTCYRSTDNRGHYSIMSYGEQVNGVVTLTIIHGRDSFMPGIGVFGIEPETLKPCGCGKWEQPTEAEAEGTYQGVMASTAHKRN